MFSLYTMLSDDEQQKVHDATLHVLETIGVSIASEDICEMLGKKGAKVIGNNVRFPREMVEEMLKHTVHSFTLGCVTEENRRVIPSTTHPFSTTAGYVPFVYDDELGKDRYANAEDLRQLCILADYDPQFEVFWPMMLPNEFKGQMQGFKATEISLRNVGKHIQMSANGKELAQYQIEMAAAVAGGRDKLRENPVISLLAAPTTPLAVEHGTAEAIVEAAKAYIPMLPMSLPQLTTTSPATFASAILLVNAENLATHMIAKCTNEDAPLYYSGDPGSPNLYTGAIDYENCEYPQLRAASMDMARFYGMPSAFGSSVEFKDFSTRAGFERNIYRAALNMLSRVDVACWMGTRDSCLSSSVVDTVLDLEVCRHALAYFRNFEVTDESLALDVLAEVGPRGNFLECDHTFENFRENIFTDKYENCYLFSEGPNNYREVASKHLDEILATHQGPQLGEDTISALDEIAASAEKTLV